MDWLKSPDLRRRAHAGLNKGEARNALARAIFFHSLGELRDSTFENQFFRASGLNLLLAAIILWNTKYLERALATLPSQQHLVQHVTPLGWEHISLTGDYSGPTKPRRRWFPTPAPGQAINARRLSSRFVRSWRA
jgi:hypothetical protein